MVLSSLDILIGHMELFWKQENSSVESVQISVPKNQRFSEEYKIIALHLNHYILHLTDLSTFTTHRMESLLVLRKWSNLTNLWKLVPSSFSKLSEQEQSSFFLGGLGICAGATIYHFHSFFAHSSPLSSIYPIKDKLEVNVGLEKIAVFHPFLMERESLHQSSGPLRFLQASYKLARLKSKECSYISEKVLRNYQLRVVKRIPELRNYFKIEDLIPQLKQSCIENKAYILGISAPKKSHALGIYPTPPFHFIDPMLGVGTAESLENLILFVANYLTEKYPLYRRFALLEFESLLPPL